MKSEASVGKVVHGVGEWAASSCNIQTGCENNCRYCYAKQFNRRFHSGERDTWDKPVLKYGAIEKGYGQRNGTVMFPTSHDITESNLTECITVLCKLIEAGNQILLVSKPRERCIEEICDTFCEERDQILFRFTIGSANDKVLRYWEPGAPAYAERIASLKLARSKGFATSISSEPMLDTDIHKVIERCKPYVTDSIWLGLANGLKGTLTLNCPGDDEAQKKAGDLIRVQNRDWVMALYEEYRNDPMIKYKDSIKKIVGIQVATVKGLDQ